MSTFATDSRGFSKDRTHSRNSEPLSGPCEGYCNDRARRSTDRSKDYDGGMYLVAAAFFAVVILALAGLWA